MSKFKVSRNEKYAKNCFDPASYGKLYENKVTNRNTTGLSEKSIRTTAVKKMHR